MNISKIALCFLLNALSVEQVYASKLSWVFSQISSARIRLSSMASQTKPIGTYRVYCDGKKILNNDQSLLVHGILYKSRVLIDTEDYLHLRDEVCMGVLTASSKGSFETFGKRYPVHPDPIATREEEDPDLGDYPVVIFRANIETDLEIRDTTPILDSLISDGPIFYEQGLSSSRTVSPASLAVLADARVYAETGAANKDIADKRNIGMLKAPVAVYLGLRKKSHSVQSLNEEVDSWINHRLLYKSFEDIGEELVFKTLPFVGYSNRDIRELLDRCHNK